MADFERRLVTRACTVREALVRLNDVGQGVLLLLDEQGRLLRTVTDGDIRRLLLSGSEFGDALSVLPEQQPKTVLEGASTAEMLAVMDRHRIDQLPVVDDGGKPAQVVHRREIGGPVLLSTPHLSDYERHYVEEAFRTNWIAPLGPNVDAFERELAERVGIEHAAALSSGTAALHLALRLLGVGPGDTVFCSSLTFVASANPILYQGADPVFIDSEPDSWNMSPQALARALEDAAADGRLPKAVIVVHLYGQSADMDPLLALCNRYEVPIIEDAAESLGATYKGQASGTHGLMGVYSFNGNKIITTSGGGMLVSRNGELIERARHLATQAREPAAHYEHVTVGYNYRMSNVLAGIGRGQLRVLEERVDARRAVFARYVEGLSDIPCLDWMPEPAYGRANRWLTVCTLRPESCASSPAEILQGLAKESIEARPVWKPMHLQPLFEGCRYYPHEPELSVSEELFEHGFCLPSGSNMSDSDQQRVVQGLRRQLA